MKKIMFKSLLIIVVAFGFNGCNNETLKSSDRKLGDVVICSQDMYDDGNIEQIAQCINLKRKGYADIALISITGKDFFNKQGQLIKAVENYFNIDIPIAIETNSEGRIAPIWEVGNNRRLDRLDNRYSGRLSIDEFTKDRLLDTQRVPSALQMCKVFKDADSVTYVSGGHLTDLADAIELCKEEIEKKLKYVIASHGLKNKTQNKPETNFSFGGNKRIVNATKKVFGLKNTKIILPNPLSYGNTNICNIGNYYLKHERGSIMDYAMAIRSYKSYPPDIHDFDVFGYVASNYNNNYGTLKKTCFAVLDDGSVNEVKGECNHYWLDIKYTTPMLCDLALKLLKK